MSSPRAARLRQLAFRVLSAGSLVMVALVPFSDLQLHRHEAMRAHLLVGLGLLALGAAARWVYPRVQAGLTLRWLDHTLRRAPECVDLLFCYLWLPLVVTATVYMVTPSSLGFIDPWLAAPELALGLPHPNTWHWFTATGAMPTLEWIYSSIDRQLQLMLLYYVLVHRDLTRVWEYATCTVLAGMVSILCSWAIPAEGPWAFYGGAATYGGLPPHSAYVTLMELRANTLTDYVNPQGLLNCPSFHTLFAVLIAWAMRGNGWISWVVAIWNGLVVLTVVPVGWHYLVDIPAGLLLAATCVGVVEWWVRRGHQPAADAPTP